MMEVKTAKEYFALGILTGFEAIRNPMSQTWLLQITGKDNRVWMMHTAKGETREFASLDTLVGQIEAIAGRVTGLKVMS